MQIKATAQVMKVTPELAHEWLANRWGEQRTVRKTHVNRLIHDMKSGDFKISPDAILRVKGKLANGQHRLEALVQHGKPQEFLVMESNDENLYKVIDAGLKRTAADSLLGIKYAANVAAIARWVLGYDAQTISPSDSSGSDAMMTGDSKNGRHYAYSQVEVINFCQENSDLLVEAAEFVEKLYEQTGLLRRAIAGALYYLAAKRGERDMAQKFLQAVYIDGGQTAAGDLRNKLINNRGAMKKWTGSYIFALTLKAYRSFRNGTRPNDLRWRKSEDFPTLDE